MPRERDPLVVGRVIGDVLDSFTKSINLSVSYNDREVINGCELKPSKVVNQPRVEIGGDDMRAFHTLVRLVSVLFSIIQLSLIFFVRDHSSKQLLSDFSCIIVVLGDGRS